jgi:hypothetical protein
MRKGGVGASLSLPAQTKFLVLLATGDQQQQQRHSLTVTAADDVADPSLIHPGLRRGMGRISAPLKEQETSKQLCFSWQQRQCC